MRTTLRSTTLRSALAVAAFSLACGLAPGADADEPCFDGWLDRTKIGQSGRVYTWRPGC